MRRARVSSSGADTGTCDVFGMKGLFPQPILFPTAGPHFHEADWTVVILIACESHSQMIQSRREAKASSACSCSRFSTAPGQTARTRASACAGVAPKRTRYAPRMTPVRPGPSCNAQPHATAHALPIDETERAVKLFGGWRGHIVYRHVERLQRVAFERGGIQRRLRQREHRADALLAQPGEISIQRRLRAIILQRARASCATATGPGRSPPRASSISQ